MLLSCLAIVDSLVVHRRRFSQTSKLSLALALFFFIILLHESCCAIVIDSPPSPSKQVSSPQMQQHVLLPTEYVAGVSSKYTVIEDSSLLSSSSSLLLSFVSDNDESGNVGGASIDVSNTQKWQSSLGTLKTEKDEVVRVLDANTVKLKKGGLITFAAVQTPSGYNKNDLQFPECMAKSPSSKARKLLPAGSKVAVRFVDGGAANNGSRPREALVVAQEDMLLVNAELVKTGFARPSARGREVSEKLLPGLAEDLQRLQSNAKVHGVGMYMRCEDFEAEQIALDDQFEPLDYTVETKYGDDGGKQVLVKRGDKNEQPPNNPGDIRGCSDFAYYEDALRWYLKFYPYYGDVANLDRDGDGVPCPGLPHTKDQGRYRMKVPTNIERLQR